MAKEEALAWEEQAWGLEYQEAEQQGWVGGDCSDEKVAKALCHRSEIKI